MSWLSRAAPKMQKPLAVPYRGLVDALHGVTVTGGTFNTAVGYARERRRVRARVYFIGNGGSAGIASHMTADWLKNGKFAAVCFNDPAMLTCLANDTGYENVFAEPLRRMGEAGDLLFAISSSGKSTSILNAVHVAKSIGMRVVTLSGFSPVNPLREAGDVNFYVPSSKYGPVEITHLSILHAILDELIESKSHEG